MAFIKGHTPWNEGLVGIKTNNRGNTPWNKGKKGLQDYMDISGLELGRKWMKGKVGKLSPNYKNGKKKDVDGYIRLLTEGTGKYERFEHRVVVEKHLGRKLKKNEIVHHVNGKRDDNRIENLKVMKKKRHDRLETKKRWKKNGVKAFNR